VSICSLLVCGAAINFLWSENYGNEASDLSKISWDSQLSSMKEAANVVKGSPDILACGIVCSLFEASMFIFVFQWTPAVSEEGAPKPPYGFIFATFMIACMLGSRIFNVATKFVPVEKVGQALLCLALVTHFVPVVCSDATVCFCAFIAFELSVGIYFPMMGTMKGMIVPEGSRSTIYNLYRVPLNFIVVGALLLQFGLRVAFSLTSLMLVAALAAQTMLATSRQSNYQAVDQEAGKGTEQKEVELQGPYVIGNEGLDDEESGL